MGFTLLQLSLLLLTLSCSVVSGQHGPHHPNACDPVRQHQCGDGRCVTRDWLCDGDQDCRDGSDELNCLVGFFGPMECGNGRRIPSTFRCDGDDDCMDGSDEENCTCDPVRQHQCGDGRCVSRDWLCDGDQDCLDRSDELNCSNRVSVPNDRRHEDSIYFNDVFTIMECESGWPIPSELQCDGEVDCMDGSDEENCTSPHPPSPDPPPSAPPPPPAPILSLSRLICHLVVASPYLLCTIILGVKYHRRGHADAGDDNGMVMFHHRPPVHCEEDADLYDVIMISDDSPANDNSTSST